jgi:hypothetical protein
MIENWQTKNLANQDMVWIGDSIQRRDLSPSLAIP